MKSVYFATRFRGFFRQLFRSSTIHVKFIYRENEVYETNNLKNKIKTSVGRSWMMDILGYIQVPKCVKIEYDIIGSFNRFLKTRKPYFIYVENPTALYHYRLNRKMSYIGAKSIRKELNNPNLKGLIFMSNACASTFEEVCGKINERCVTKTIYPLVPLNPYVDQDIIKKKTSISELKLLYIAQGIRFKSKGGLEVIEAFKRLKIQGLNISLRIITSFKDISSELIENIKQVEGIILDDFCFTFQELQTIYRNSHILLIPTSDDSFNLTVLEAMKSGLPIIGSRLYAIPEMVTDEINGYLCDPHYWFFDQNNIPNPKVWNNRKQTIYSGKMSDDIIHFLIEKIKFLYENRDVLEAMSLKSLEKATKEPFSEEYIASQWNAFFNKI